MKVIELTVKFRCNENVNDDDVSSWMDDILDLVADYDSFEEITGYALTELPEVSNSNSYIETQ